MPETLAVRPYVDADMDQVLEVLRLSLGEPPGLTRTHHLFAWKHLANPFGRSIMLVAEEGDRIAGFRAFMRWDLHGPEGAMLRCVRAVDTATHPDFQRRGIFRTLTLAGIEHAGDAGIDLIFNTPNAKSGAGYLTMGWTELAQIGVMARPRLQLLRGRQRGEWSPGPGRIDHSELAGAAEVLDRPARGWRTPRTAAYLQWRYGSHPTARYLLARREGDAAIARAHLRSGRRELVLSELGGPGRSIGRVIGQSHPDYLVAWFSDGTPERRASWRHAILPVPRIRALTVMYRPVRALDLDLSWSKWDFSLGDLELL
jgi:GNAT superfamily N-acetyltransferase